MASGRSGAGIVVGRLGWPVCNAWLLDVPEHGFVMVDSGYPALWPAMVARMRHWGVRPRDLAGVVLTHRHSDHAGNAARLLDLGIPVHAHRRDAEVLSGERSRPRLAGIRRLERLFCHMENRHPAAPCRPRPLDDGDHVLGLDVHWVPGHTAGSVFLHHRASGTLFSGDGLLNAIPPSTVRTGLCLPHSAFAEDLAQALGALTSFVDKGLDVRLLCAGHGPPRSGPIGEAVRALLTAR